MKNEYFFSFISRSGGHAIIYWISGMITNKVIRYEHYWRNKSKFVFLKNGNELNIKKDDYNKFDFRLFSIENIIEPYKNITPDITIIRSPSNLFASLYKKSIQSKWYIEEEKLKETYLNHLNSNGLIIIYDLWFISEKYRKYISKKLNLPYSTKNLNFVSSFGSGSSFDLQKFKGDAQKMDVLNRYRYLPENILSEFNSKYYELNNLFNNLYNIHENLLF